MSQTKRERVLIVGASDKPERYAHKAMLSLLDHGHEVVLVHPILRQIGTHPVRNDLKEVLAPVDTVTLYVGPSISSSLGEKLIALAPRRVIFNPGTENPELESELKAAGVPTEHACTLVLLATGVF